MNQFVPGLQRVRQFRRRVTDQPLPRRRKVYVARRKIEIEKSDRAALGQQAETSGALCILTTPCRCGLRSLDGRNVARCASKLFFESHPHVAQRALLRLERERRIAADSGEEHLPLRLDEFRIVGDDFEREQRCKRAADQTRLARMPELARSGIRRNNPAVAVQYNDAKELRAQARGTGRTGREGGR